jgi:peptidoglycan lytic transglycosylase
MGDPTTPPTRMTRMAVASLRPQTRRGRAPAGGRRPRQRRRRRVALVVLSVAAVAGAGLVLFDPVEDALKEITLPLRHDDIIRQQARDKNLDAALIAAVIYRESKFRNQTSKAGAKGLMQILPETADFVAHKTGGTEFEQGDLSDPQINISYGCWYLRYLLDLYGGNRLAAVAAYNAGHRRVDRWGAEALRMEDIRFPETRQYAEDVLEKRDEYAERYTKELGLPG